MTKKRTPKIGDIVKRKTPAREKKHYVNNKDFYDALTIYKAECNIVEEKWLSKYGEKQKELLESGVKKKHLFDHLPKIPWPLISDYLGECVFKIAHKLNNAPNFCSYTYRDEMIADGYEDCILRIRSFNPEKSTNPFAYFTQTCYFASVRRIKKEKKQSTVRSEMIKNSGIIDSMTMATIDCDNAVYNNNYLSFLLDHVDEDVADSKLDKGRKIVKKTTKAYQKKLKELKEVEDRERERNRIIDAESKEYDSFAHIKEYNHYNIEE